MFIEAIHQVFAELPPALSSPLGALSCNEPISVYKGTLDQRFPKVKQGIVFALEYQKRHRGFWEICAKKAVQEMYRDLDPVEATKLELRYQEACEELQEYIDTC